MAFNSLAELDKQSESIVSGPEKYNKISQFESILAGVGSGLIQIPKGLFSLGASLIDLGAGTNKAAQVEKYFDDLTELDEKAAATTAGKITELLVNIGVPGGVGFKIGTSMANAALRSKKLGKYFTMTDESGKVLMESASKLARLNQKGRVAKFGVGAITGGTAEGIFIGDVEKAGTFGQLIGGPTRLHENKGENYDPGRALVNRVKFGTEGALFTGLIGGLGKTLKLLSGRTEAMRYADNAMDKTIFNWLSKLKKEGKTTPEFFEAQRKIIGQKYADINLGQTVTRNLNKKIDGLFPWMQRTFDRSTKPQRKELLELLNDGLVSGTPKVLDNGTVQFGETLVRKITDPLTKKVKTIKDTGGINKSFKTKVEKFLNKNNIAHDPKQIGDIFDQLEAIRGEWAGMFSTLGKGIKEGEKAKIKGMKGAFSEYKTLFGKKFKNYLGATYDIFSNRSIIPMLNYKVPTQVMDKAIKVFRSAAAANKTPITHQEAKTLINGIAETATAPKNFDKDALVKLPDFFTGKSMAQRAGSKELEVSFLKGDKRKIVEEILGKTKNPVETILSQTTAISNITRRNLLLNTLALSSNAAVKAGKRPLFFNSPEEIFKVAQKHGQDLAETQIAKTGDRITKDTMYRQININNLESGIGNPAAGKYALKEVADAIEVASGRRPVTWADNAIYRNLVLLPKATSQMAKTILSPVTHARNFISAGAFAVANGLAPGIGITARNAKSAWRNLQVAAPFTRAETDLYRRLARLGVVNTNVRMGDLRHLLKDIDFGSTVSADRGMRGLLKYFSKAKKWTEDAYTAEDDFWKIVTFLGERSRYAAAYKRAGKTISDDALDEMAANIVRNNVPNYDYVSESIRALRRWPVGNFVSFPAEILRTSTNILKTALREIKDPMLRRIGMQRLTGMAFTMAAVPYGATKLGQTLYDVSEEQLAAIRRFVAPWSKNSTIIPLKDEEGNWKYIDFSHANAYDTLLKPWQAAINEVADGQLNDEAIMNNFLLGSLKGFGDIAQPFVSESIWTEALADVMIRTGRTREGYEVWNENDSDGVKAEKIFMHLLKAQMPGSLKQLGRIDYAITGFDTPLQQGDLGGPFKWGKIGKYDENGRSYEILDEGLGIAGMRAVKLDIKNALNFKQANFASGERNSKKIFNKVALKKGPIDPVELVDAYLAANKALWKVQKTMSDDIKGAQELGMNTSDVFLATKRLGNKTFGRLISDTFQPYEVSNNIINSMALNAREIGLDNPYSEVSSAINAILRQLYQINLKPGAEWPEIINPLRVVGSKDKVSIQPNIPIETEQVSEEVVQTSALPSNVNQNSGLTSIEEALLSNEEKAMRLRQRGLTA
jgi:hypothetical protein